MQMEISHQFAPFISQFLVALVESYYWLLLVFFPKFWEVVGTYEWHFVVL